tara:strand:- start:161 stop:466 length:306 start_codon:yes stop_codon:yes gene_type:complete
MTNKFTYLILIFLLSFLLGCSNKNYSITKKPICKELVGKNKLIVNCNEYKELYHLTINDLNKSLLICYKKDFKINLDGQITKQTFLKCHSQDSEKQMVYFF